MAACASCGADVPASDAFCSACGRPVASPDGVPAIAEEGSLVGEMTRRPVRPEGNPDVTSRPRRPVAPATHVHDGGATGAGVVIAAADHDSELEGQAVPNQFYVGQRLGYKEGGAENLDPVNPRFALGLLMHWAAVFFIFVVGGAAIFLVGRILGSIEARRNTGLLSGGWLSGIVAWWFPVWARSRSGSLWWMARRRRPERRFSTSLGSSSGANHPSIALRFIGSRLGISQSREYLYVQDGVFRAYVACFPFGHDLYVGWTMWWRLSAVRWFWTIIKTLLPGVHAAGSELHRSTVTTRQRPCARPSMAQPVRALTPPPVSSDRAAPALQARDCGRRPRSDGGPRPAMVRTLPPRPT